MEKDVSLHGILTLELGALAVHEGCGQATTEEVIVHILTRVSSVDEDESTARLLGVEKVNESVGLGAVVDIDDVLLDILVSGTSATDADAKVVLCHILTGKTATLGRERGREHHVKMVSVLVGV